MSAVLAILVMTIDSASAQNQLLAATRSSAASANCYPLVSRAGESANVIVDVTAAAGQLRSLPAVLLRE